MYTGDGNITEPKLVTIPGTGIITKNYETTSFFTWKIYGC